MDLNRAAIALRDVMRIPRDEYRIRETLRPISCPESREVPYAGWVGPEYAGVLIVGKNPGGGGQWICTHGPCSLRRRQDAIDVEEQIRRSGERLWADGARKYLIECKQRKVRTLEQIAYHVELLLPYIGDQPLADICNDNLECFKLDRIDDGVKNATINRSLEVVRTVLNRPFRVWRDGPKPWLTAPPLIEWLDEDAG